MASCAVVGEAERVEETGIVDTGTVKARAMSEFCATGEVAVCAVVSFSFFLHLALLFWNHTCDWYIQMKGDDQA